MYQKILLFSFTASFLSLAAALVAEYGFGLMPCELCILQRIPYGVVMALSLAGLKFSRTARTFLLYMILLCFLSDTAIATYHSLVEKHWVKGPDACTSSVAATPLSLEEMLQKIEAAPIVACDQPQWQWHGITMAMLNAIWSFCLSCAMVFAIRRESNAKAAGRFK